MRFEALVRAWTYICEWGCQEHGYPSHEAAQAAYDTHDCKGMRP